MQVGEKNGLLNNGPPKLKNRYTFFQEALLNDKSFDFFPLCLDPLLGVDPLMLLCQEICPLCAQILQRGVPETAPFFAVGGGGQEEGFKNFRCV